MKFTVYLKTTRRGRVIKLIWCIERIKQRIIIDFWRRHIVSLLYQWNIRSTLTIKIDTRHKRVFTQRLFYSTMQNLKNCRLLFELNLSLRRMNIYIYPILISLQIDKPRWSKPIRNQATIRLHDCLLHVTTSEKASINEKILITGSLASILRPPNESSNINNRRLNIDRYKFTSDIFTNKR
ncbi:hypothetical protein SDC9_130755 [bioreactor metagenome]|uniref:Uncharacterized protein n=1 Tax=bioreactor metagenome TaxID=1076179 RepID=A0A645D2V1_9ZZZZ